MEDKIKRIVLAAIGGMAKDIAVHVDGSTINVIADESTYMVSVSGVYGIQSKHRIGNTEMAIAEALSNVSKDMFIAMLPF